ncbi:MAG: HEAT repeat domain-containing protein, partial [Candidatus Zixiibacteriota bacterium]
MNPQIRKSGIVVALILLFLFGYFVYDTFRTRSLTEKLAEIVHTEDLRKLTRTLQNYLKDDDPKVRERAALAIGRIGGSEGAKLLFELISNDASIDVTSTAAFALGLSGAKQYAGQLLEIAYDLPGRVGAQAVLAAGRLSDSSSASEHLVLESYFTHPSPEVREAACYAAFICKAQLASAKMFDLFNTEPDENVRVAALYSLARMGIAQAEAIYRGYLADADPFVRSIAVRGLSFSTSDESTHLLSIASNDSDPGVAASALTALGKRKSSEAQKQLLKKIGLVN